MQQIQSTQKLLGETTEADAQKAGFKSLGAFVDAWLDKHGEWNPSEVISDGQASETNGGLFPPLRK